MFLKLRDCEYVYVCAFARVCQIFGYFYIKKKKKYEEMVIRVNLDT